MRPNEPYSAHRVQHPSGSPTVPASPCFVVSASFADPPITFGVSLIGADSGQGDRAFAYHSIRSYRQRMRLQPQRAGGDGRINASTLHYAA